MVNEGCLSNEDFLGRIPAYFQNTNEQVVRLTAKRLVNRDPVEGNKEFDTVQNPSFDVSKKAQSLQVKECSNEVYPILIRMKFGSKKCSTIVSADALDKFWQDYSSSVKSSMKGLIKKKKKKTRTTGVKSKREKK